MYLAEIVAAQKRGEAKGITSVCSAHPFVLKQTLRVFAKHPRNEVEGAKTFRVSSCFKRIMRPQGVALPILNCAVWLERENDSIRDIRIAVGPGGGTPFRATHAKDVLHGQSATEKRIESAFEALLAQAQFRTSARRAGAEYRRHIVRGLFKDTLNSALERASR